MIRHLEWIKIFNDIGFGFFFNLFISAYEKEGCNESNYGKKLFYPDKDVMVTELRANLTAINEKLDELGEVLASLETEITKIRSECHSKLERSESKFLTIE